MLTWKWKFRPCLSPSQESRKDVNNIYMQNENYYYKLFLYTHQCGRFIYDLFVCHDKMCFKLETSENLKYINPTRDKFHNIKTCNFSQHLNVNKTKTKHLTTLQPVHSFPNTFAPPLTGLGVGLPYVFCNHAYRYIWWCKVILMRFLTNWNSI